MVDLCLIDNYKNVGIKITLLVQVFVTIKMIEYTYVKIGNLKQIKKINVFDLIKLYCLLRLIFNASFMTISNGDFDCFL